MPSDAFLQKTASLRRLGPQRVWSLMISLFGDLAQAKGAVIEGPVLSAIMAGLDVRPEAARVALYRLRNDGWITSEKAGRISHHSLTAKGRAQSIAASPRIYAAPAGPTEDWHLVIVQDAAPELTESMTAAGFTTLLPRVFAGPLGALPPKDALVLRGSQAPLWLRDEVQPTALHADYVALQGALADLAAALPDGSRPSAIETAILRCLIVHNWRRLVLKHPALPGSMVDTTSPSHHCHLLVTDLLARFPRPALRDIAITAGPA